MKKSLLMCKPSFYNVDYVINPHMAGNVNKVDRNLALIQWTNLYNIISDLAVVELIDQAPGLPDMTFTANAGFVVPDLNHVWISRFAKSERRGEERLFAGWFIAYGLDLIEQPTAQSNFFEGAGDTLVGSSGTYWLGYGMRSSVDAVKTIQKFYEARDCITLELRDPRFYHLDTCFAPLSKGHYLWYPPAFTTPVNMGGLEKYPDMLIDVSEEDALQFACNVVCIDDVVIMPLCSDQLRDRVRSLGYDVISVDMSEFMKAGGAAKCLTLQLN
jgi:N-dimethylarginine dimethylaminohydrolase